MIKHLYAVLIFLPLTYVYGQTTIYPIENHGNVPDDYTNVYFKDLNNDLDKYVGTWVWEENGHKLTVVMEKSIQYYLFHRWYEDIIIGNYKYEENGVLIIDTMTNPVFNPVYTNEQFHIQLNGFNQSEHLNYLHGSYFDPIISLYASFDLHCTFIQPEVVIAGAVQIPEPAKMRWYLLSSGFRPVAPDEPLDTTRPYMPRVPSDVILVKQ